MKPFMKIAEKIAEKLLHFTACRVVRVSGSCYCLFMNTLDEIKTNVFCSQCDRVTSDFLEWAGEFWCEEECVAYLPTQALMEEQDFGDADSEWLASAGWGDDEDYGYYGD